MEQQINNRFESYLIENREVRIFLSSTFSDMKAEVLQASILLQNVSIRMKTSSLKMAGTSPQPSCRLDRFDNTLIMPLWLLALRRCSGEQARGLPLLRLTGKLKCGNS